MCLYRYATKLEVLEVLKRSRYVLHVMVVAGGLWASPLPASKTRGKGSLISREKVEQRHLKAKAFQSKVKLTQTAVAQPMLTCKPLIHLEMCYDVLWLILGQLLSPQ